jgi:transcription-repair coupling factor (superfamily II helicase)
LAGNDRLRIERELPEPHARAQMVRDVLRSLGTPLVQKLANATATASTEKQG